MTGSLGAGGTDRRGQRGRPVAPAAGHAGTTGRLRVDPVACDGVGMCALLAPDLIGLDRWGFPILYRQPPTRAAERSARAAVAGCPRRALYWQQRHAASG